jgi:hypothetical protein
VAMVAAATAVVATAVVATAVVATAAVATAAVAMGAGTVVATVAQTAPQVLLQAGPRAMAVPARQITTVETRHCTVGLPLRSPNAPRAN